MLQWPKFARRLAEVTCRVTNQLPSMSTCKDCFHYSPTTESEGECRIIGKTEADRDKDRCPSRTFRP
ncbi:MAG: hypothetical protein LUP99_04665, partial [Methanomicrobiales archaeon]|nr:hypothetical protein [Methanomicrobiales archaeon]